MKFTIHKGIFVICVYCIAISVPLLDMKFKFDPSPYLDENRTINKRPLLTLSASFAELQKFPQDFTKYFNDNFGFRNTLVRGNFLIRHEVLGESPSPQVLFGKDGWLFYTGNNELEDYRGITQFDNKILGIWASSLEQKRSWLAKNGIRYLFVVAPNKTSIYGEYLPDVYNRVREKTYIDELITYLKLNTKVEVVDLRKNLLLLKGKERLYDKTGTHWNELGAFYAYREIMKPIVIWFPVINVQSADDFIIQKNIGNGTELAIMSGGSEFIKEEYVHFKPLKPRIDGLTYIDDMKKSPITIIKPDNALPRAVVFRDSFFSKVAPYLSENFQFTKYYWQCWDSATPMTEIIKAHRPDIVIEEIVERLVKRDMQDFYNKPPEFMTRSNTIQPL